MAAITLANLRTAALLRADMASSDFVSAAEVTALVNVEAAELHAELVTVYEDQFTTSATFTISSGNVYALASVTASAPFFKLRGLDRDEGGGDWRELERFDFLDRNRRRSGGGNGRDVRYRLVGANIVLTPDDAATGTYRLWYVPGWVDLSADGDTLDVPENWHEFVVSGVAAKLLQKEESDSRSQLAAKENVRARIRAAAQNRDASGPERMARIRTRYTYDRDVDDADMGW